MARKVKGVYYRKYINHKSNCWVMYDKDHNSIKKRTMYTGDHIMCRKAGKETVFTDTYYYPTATRNYKGEEIMDSGKVTCTLDNEEYIQLEDTCDDLRLVIVAESGELILDIERVEKLYGLLGSWLGMGIGEECD